MKVDLVGAFWYLFLIILEYIKIGICKIFKFLGKKNDGAATTQTPSIDYI